MEALAAMVVANKDARKAIDAMVQQGLELQDILVLLGYKFGLDLVVEDGDGNEVEEDLDDMWSLMMRTRRVMIWLLPVRGLMM